VLPISHLGSPYQDEADARGLQRVGIGHGRLLAQGFLDGTERRGATPRPVLATLDVV
jgi:hypothetical protein